jgi:hypothetical protein
MMMGKVYNERAINSVKFKIALRELKFVGTLCHHTLTPFHDLWKIFLHEHRTPMSV